MQLWFFLNSSSCPEWPDLHQLFLKIKLHPSTSSNSSVLSWGKMCHLLRNLGFLVNQFSKARQNLTYCKTNNTLMLGMYFWMLLLPSLCDPFLEPKTHHVSTQEWTIHSVSVSDTVVVLVPLTTVHFLHKNKSKCYFPVRKKDGKKVQVL